MSAVLATERPDPDLFGEAPGPRSTCLLQFTGRLRTKPHVASMLIDREGHVVPVLVLELADVGAGHHAIVAHVPYTQATRHDAEAAARRLQRDQVVTVSTGLESIRMLLGAATLSTEPA